MNYLLDTCVVSDFFKMDSATIAHFKSISPKQIYISTITFMEIEFGLNLKPQRRKKIQPLWNQLLQHIQVVPYTPFCAQSTATVRAHLQKSGLPVGPYDVLIAGTALAHDLILVTSNTKEFSRIPELTVVNWR